MAPTPTAPIVQGAVASPPRPGHRAVQRQPGRAALAARLPWRDLLPLRSWFSDSAWRQGWIGVFLAAALAPSALSHLTENDLDIHRTAWGYALYFALLWLVAIFALLRPEPQDPWLLVRVVAFTAVAVWLAIQLEKHWAPTNTHSLVGMTLGVGLPEEFAKALPVFLFLFLGGRNWSTRTYIFVGVVSGLGFGVKEGVLYSSLYAQNSDFFTATSFASAETWRLLTDGLWHACTAGITAYFIGLASLLRKAAVPLIAFGLILTSVLHGMNDAWSNGWPSFAVTALIVFIFVGYVRNGDAIVAKLRSQGGIS